MKTIKKGFRWERFALHGFGFPANGLTTFDSQYPKTDTTKMLQPIDTKLSSSSSSSAPSSTLSSSFIFHHQRCYVLSQPLDPSTPSTLSWVQWFHCFALNGSSGLFETVDAQFFTSGFPKSCVTFSLLVMTMVVSPKESTCITPNGTYLFKGGTVLGPTMFKKNHVGPVQSQLRIKFMGTSLIKTHRWLDDAPAFSKPAIQCHEKDVPMASLLLHNRHSDAITN